jgi:hypothetical protein
LFRKMKATAAARGVSMKELVVAAVDRDVNAGPKAGKKKRSPFPPIHPEHTKMLNLSNFDFDDLLT